MVRYASIVQEFDERATPLTPFGEMVLDRKNMTDLMTLVIRRNFNSEGDIPRFDKFLNNAMDICEKQYEELDPTMDDTTTWKSLYIRHMMIEPEVIHTLVMYDTFFRTLFNAYVDEEGHLTWERFETFLYDMELIPKCGSAYNFEVLYYNAENIDQETHPRHLVKKIQGENEGIQEKRLSIVRKCIEKFGTLNGAWAAVDPPGSTKLSVFSISLQAFFRNKLGVKHDVAQAVCEALCSETEDKRVTKNLFMGLEFLNRDFGFMNPSENDNIIRNARGTIGLNPEQTLRLRRDSKDSGDQLKKKLANKIFRYLARCDFWAKLGLRFLIL